MRALQPWIGLTSLRKEMERLFDRFWEPDFPELVPVGEWNPRLDLSETKDALVLRAEIPGIEAKDVQMERSHGVFARSVRIPVPVEREKVTAKFKNGLLTVTLPKAPSAKQTTIPVKAE
jgi:HSP20 family protein